MFSIVLSLNNTHVKIRLKPIRPAEMIDFNAVLLNVPEYGSSLKDDRSVRS